MIATLLETPTDAQGWARFAFPNRTSHEAIRAAVAANGGPALTAYILEPIDLEQFAQWLQLHAQAHYEMDGALGVQSADFSVLDPEDPQAVAQWAYVHWQEHQTAEAVLGIIS